MHDYQCLPKRQRHLFRRGAKWVCVWSIMLLGDGVSANEVVPPATQEVGQYQFQLLLNKEYIAALNQRRQHHAPGSAPARFDLTLMRSAALFNRKLDVEDTLCHDLNNRTSELCGSLENVRSWKPRELAQHILAQLAASPPHEAVQTDDHDMLYVGISSSTKRFVVRLSNTPSSRSNNQ